jgi:hypothetical protein
VALAPLSDGLNFNQARRRRREEAQINAAVLVLVCKLFAARERKEHREISLRSLRSFAAKSAKQAAVLVLVY